MCSLLHTPCCLIHCNNFLLYAAWIFRREEILHLRPLGFLCFLLTDVCYIHYANIPASIFPESSIWRGLLALISGAFQTSASSSPLCCVLNYSWVAQMFVCCIWDEAWILNKVDCNLNLYLDLAVFLLDENSVFLSFLHNDAINWLSVGLIRRGAILFSHAVLVKQRVCKDKKRLSKQSLMSPCPNLLISPSPIALGHWSKPFPSPWIYISCFQQSCINESCVWRTLAWYAFFAGFLISNLACIQMTILSNYPVYFHSL